MLEGEIRSWRPDIIAGTIAIVAVMATLLSGQFATYPSLPWYEQLAKPSFNPPSWVFTEVWATLYALMAYALFRILRLRDRSQERTRALIMFFVMLMLNAAWSWMFFGARSPLLGLITIVPQLAVTVATGITFWKLNKIAALCLVPLAGWVAFTTVLNSTIWWLNQ
jgi:tryptophan-rich sensory protein